MPGEDDIKANAHIRAPHIPAAVILMTLWFLPLSPYALSSEIADRNPEITRHLHNYSDAHRSKDFNTALSEIRAAHSLSRAMFGEQDPYTVDLFIRIGGVYNDYGRDLEGKGQYPPAEKNYLGALTVFQSLPDSTSLYLGSTYSNLGSIYYKMGRYSDSVRYSRLSLDIYRKHFGKEHQHVGTLYLQLSQGYQLGGKYEESLRCSRKALKIYQRVFGDEHPNTAHIYVNTGEINNARGDYARALEFHNRALGIYRKSFGPDHESVATVQNYIGGTLKSKGDYEGAIAHYMEAAEIYRKKLGETHPYLGTTYHNIGGAYEPQGLYDRAIEYYNKASKIYIERLGKDHVFNATLYNNLGLTYRKKNYFSRALHFYKKSLEVYYTHYHREHPYIAITLFNIGDLYRAMGKHEESVHYFMKTIPLFKNSGRRFEYLHTLSDIAAAYQRNGNLEGARKYYKKAVAGILRYRLELGRSRTAFTSQYIPVFDRLIQLYMKQDNFEEAFRTDNSRRGLSISEDMDIQEALTRGGVPDSDIREYTSQKNILRQLQVRREVAIEENNSAGADALLAEIWAAEQKSETIDRNLQKRFPAYRALRAPGVPSVAEIRKHLSRDEAILSYSLTGNNHFAYIITRERGLEIAGLGGVTGASLALKIRNFHSLLKSDIRKSLYSWIHTGSGNNIIWNRSADSEAYTVTGNEVTAIVKQWNAISGTAPASMNESYNIKKIGTLEGTLTPETAGKFREKLSRELYIQLAGPVLDRLQGIKKLIIIPDGATYYLPFGLLKNPGGKYFFETHSHRYIHSAIVWNAIMKRQPSKALLPLLAVGNPVYARGHVDTGAEGVRGLRRAMKGGIPGELKIINRNGSNGVPLGILEFSNLPGTGEEVELLSQVAYNMPAGGNRNCLTGLNASEDILRPMARDRKLREYRILHFAVHGLFVEGNPAMNALVLSRPHIARGLNSYGPFVRQHGPMKEDGFLRLGEVRALDLDADLVVMSACDTSLGIETAGEGMVGLPQAFLMGGARSVIASLWPVDDEAAGQLMEELYKNMLRKGMRPEEALQKAQQSVRAEYNDPYYWGAFVQYGK